MTLPDEMTQSDDFEIIPQALDAITFFLKIQTQWRTDQGVLLGLDYNVLFKLMDIEKVENPLEILSDVQLIEAKVVEILSERSK